MTQKLQLSNYFEFKANIWTCIISARVGILKTCHILILERLKRPSFAAPYIAPMASNCSIFNAKLGIPHPVKENFKAQSNWWADRSAILRIYKGHALLLHLPQSYLTGNHVVKSDLTNLALGFVHKRSGKEITTRVEWGLFFTCRSIQALYDPRYFVSFRAFIISWGCNFPHDKRLTVCFLNNRLFMVCTVHNSLSIPRHNYYKPQLSLGLWQRRKLQVATRHRKRLCSEGDFQWLWFAIW